MMVILVLCNWIQIMFSIEIFSWLCFVSRDMTSDNVDCSIGNNHMPIYLCKVTANLSQIEEGNFITVCHWSWHLVKVGVCLE